MGSSLSLFFFLHRFRNSNRDMHGIGRYYREGKEYLFRLISLENRELRSIKWKGNWRRDWREKRVELLGIGKILRSLLRACRLFSPSKWMFIIQFIETNR